MRFGSSGRSAGPDPNDPLKTIRLVPEIVVALVGRKTK
jgi:hypothetical protein